MLFYVNIYGSYKLSKNSPVFLAHPVYLVGKPTVNFLFVIIKLFFRYLLRLRRY